MRIGILSMQRVINYGSFWQALLLKKIFIDMGHQVEFMDIIPGRRLREKQECVRTLERLSHLPNKFVFRPRRTRILRECQRRNLGLPETANYSCDYDCIIIGSDEVFNFAQASEWGFSPQLHGRIDNDNVNTYAASFGTSTYEDIERYGVLEEMRAASGNFKHISVRDDNSYQIMKQLLPEREVFRHLDPVLVGDLPVPARQPVKHRYLMIYAYDYRFKNQTHIQRIRSFAKEHDLKVYSVGSWQGWVDRNISVDPYELLQYFVNAEYVVTDTFHGTIFSVRCHKQFVTVIREGREGNQQKISSLLADLGLIDRILKTADQFETIMVKPIRYDEVDQILIKEQKRSICYLEQCVEENKKKTYEGADK